MRQGQQNRRGRGRGRKPQNPLSRSYESNGPDVKIRGTASHIAEKYMSLARDALASGDMVTAESYLQHAEHYNRIIMAAQTQATSQPGAPQGDAPNGGRQQSRWHSDSDDEGSDETAEAGGQGGGGQAENVSQDRQRHEGNREHHGGGRERGRGRQRGNGNGAEAVQDANGAEPAEAKSADENETAPDVAS